MIVEVPRRTPVAGIIIAVLVVSAAGLLLYQTQQYRYCIGEDAGRWNLGPTEAKTLEDFRYVRDRDLVEKVIATQNETEAAQVLCRAVSRSAFTSLFKREAN